MSKKLDRFLRKLNTRWLNKILIALAVISIAVGGILYWVAGKGAEASLYEQTLLREKVVALAGAKSIESFLELFEGSIALLARDNDVINIGVDTQTVLDEFISDWEDSPVVEVILVDKEGIVRFVANKAGAGIKEGISVVDRDYFIWAEEAEQGDTFIGKPILPRLGAFEGQYILPVSTPVIENEEFKGVLGFAILVPELANSYLDPLKISEDTLVYLVNSEGIFLYSSIPGLVGKNMFDYLRENSFPGSETIIGLIQDKISESEDEGAFSYTRPDRRNEKTMSRYLLAYSRIHLRKAPEQKETAKPWFLAVECPAEEILSFYGRFQKQQLTELFFLVFVVLAILLLVILTIRIAQRDSYLNGFVDGRDHNHIIIQEKPKGKKS